MLLHELLDVPLVARLRPAALVVPAGLLLEVVADLLQPPCLQPVQVSLLAPDDGDDRPVRARDDGNERREEEVPADLEAVGHGLGQGDRRPEVVEARGEDRRRLRAVTVEVVVEPARDPLEVRLQAAALLVRQILTGDLLGGV